MANKRPDVGGPAPKERYRDFVYELRVSHVEGRGFVAQAEIVAGAGLVIGQVVGSPDVTVATREEAERVARSLAIQWIDENAKA